MTKQNDTIKLKENFNKCINIAVMGDSRCGKSSLIECYLNEKIVEENIETILNIHETKFNLKNLDLTVNIFEISGNFDRDKDLVIDYIKYSHIFLLCYSFENDFVEDKFFFWLDLIEKLSENSGNYVYLVGLKYDMRIMIDYQKGLNITTLMFENENLTSFGERIKNFINSNIIKEYFMVSALLNFNVKEMFSSVLKDNIYDRIYELSKKEDLIENKNCIIY